MFHRPDKVPSARFLKIFKNELFNIIYLKTKFEI